LAAPEPPDGTDAKKRFILTAGFDDQEALLQPPPEPIFDPRLVLPTAQRLPSPPVKQRPVSGPGVHRFVADPTSHPAWSELLGRALELGLAAWQAHVVFRLALIALHERDPETRLTALGRLCAELDPWLRPREPLVVGPTNPVAPSASPIASPRLPGLSLFAGLELPEASPEDVASIPAALTAWAAWYAPALSLFEPEGEPEAPLDLVRAIGEALARPITTTPLPFPVAPERRAPADLVASGVMTLEVRGARLLAAQDSAQAVRSLPALIRRAPIPAARVALMGALARALRAVHDLPPPAIDGPGLLAQMTARLASPLHSVITTALAELDALVHTTDPIGLGLDVPTRYPDALATARRALAAHRPVPRWVIANTQGADRGLLCATLMGRLPSVDPHLLQALVDLAPADLEPALIEMTRETWVDAETRAVAKDWLERLGRGAW